MVPRWFWAVLGLLAGSLVVVGVIAVAQLPEPEPEPTRRPVVNVERTPRPLPTVPWPTFTIPDLTIPDVSQWSDG
ncbi:MAG: hypothetical protein FWE61_01435 [Micrococcales bacterium]|nr:hypothetical protein [Micrococcales bacterium]